MRHQVLSWKLINLPQVIRTIKLDMHHMLLNGGQSLKISMQAWAFWEPQFLSYALSSLEPMIKGAIIVLLHLGLATLVQAKQQGDSKTLLCAWIPLRPPFLLVLLFNTMMASALTALPRLYLCPLAQDKSINSKRTLPWIQSLKWRVFHSSNKAPLDVVCTLLPALSSGSIKIWAWSTTTCSQVIIQSIVLGSMSLSQIYLSYLRLSLQCILAQDIQIQWFSHWTLTEGHDLEFMWHFWLGSNLAGAFSWCQMGAWFTLVLLSVFLTITTSIMPSFSKGWIQIQAKKHACQLITYPISAPSPTVFKTTRISTQTRPTIC